MLIKSLNLIQSDNKNLFFFLLFTCKRPRNSRSLRILTTTFSSRLNRTKSSGSSTDVVAVVVVCTHRKRLKNDFKQKIFT
jgi:hypothetical protein